MVPPAPLEGGQDDAGFEALTRRVLDAFGFDLTQYKPNYLKRRIAVRMRALGVTDYASYLALLDRGEWEKLHGRITIHVTEFFRDPEAYAFIEREVLPGLVKELKARGETTFRAWSAGCSTGEEPYSLAMMLAEATGGEMPVRVTATDIDPGCLDFGRAGVYEAASVRGVREAWRRRWFSARADGRVQVEDALRGMVQFRRHHLLLDAPLAAQHLVLCRNVMIYFGKDQHQPLYEAFHRSLDPGGYLVIGKTESMMGRARERFVCVSARERVYRRIEPTP